MLRIMQQQSLAWRSPALGGFIAERPCGPPG